jgi:hypothetical protein
VGHWMVVDGWGKMGTDTIYCENIAICVSS